MGFSVTSMQSPHICIPNWDIGTELAALSDTFWNEERLRNYSKMKKVDACTVVTALKILADNECIG